jgi:hypothetical protein
MAYRRELRGIYDNAELAKQRKAELVKTENNNAVEISEIELNTDI